MPCGKTSAPSLRKATNICIILSGDQLYRMEYRDIIQQHIVGGADLTIACIPVNREAATAFGIMETDETSKITRFVEKPTDPRFCPSSG
jgi:glucose-1-phosphate adenylyltransferase